MTGRYRLLPEGASCGKNAHFPISATTGTLPLRLPEDVANRLKNVAEARGVSVNELITEISIQALAAYDTETRFKAMAVEADISAALAVLNRLDRQMTESFQI